MNNKSDRDRAGKGIARPRTKLRGKSTTQGTYYIYGQHTVRAAIANPARQKTTLFATPNALVRLQEVSEIGEIEVQTVSPKDLDRMAGTNAVHQGLVLKVAPLPRTDLASLENYRLIVVLDQITDPHNVGAILRTACAFGANAVITTARHAPQETGVLAKSASGALDLVPFVEVNNLGEAIKTLKRQAVWCIGLDSEAQTAMGQPLGIENIALVLGAEGKGLRHKTRQLCDQMLRLDMPGPIKSLNVSNAAAISLFALSGLSRQP